jgi:hypothetical protein
MSNPITVTFLRNNKDDTISIYPHERRTDALVVKHRYSENTVTDTLTIVRKDEIEDYFAVLFDYAIGMNSVNGVSDRYKRVTINCPGLPHFDQEITDTALVNLRAAIEDIIRFAADFVVRSWPVTVARSNELMQPPVVVRTITNQKSKKSDKAAAAAE